MGPGTEERENLLIDLWMRQTDIFLKLVSLMPVVELGIAAGWYNLMQDQMWILALLTAIIGMTVMILSWMYLYRATVYIGQFRAAVTKMVEIPPTRLKDLVGLPEWLEKKLPEWVPKRLPEWLGEWKITGRKAGLFIPDSAYSSI